MLAHMIFFLAAALAPAQQEPVPLFDALKSAILYAVGDAGNVAHMSGPVFVNVPSFEGMADSLAVTLPKARALAAAAGQRGKALVRPDSIQTCRTLQSQFADVPNPVICTIPENAIMVEAYRLLRNADGTVMILISVRNTFGEGNRKRMSGPVYALTLRQAGERFEVVSIKGFLR